MSLSFNEYQSEAYKTAEYPDTGKNMIYPALGLAGEAGEVANKVKQMWRNHGLMSGHKLSLEDVSKIELELGDTLWYIAALASELDITLYEIASHNLTKLKDRKERNVIKGEGDNR